MKKTVGIVGFVLAFVFLILGLCSVTPDKYIKSYGDGKMYEYVGGDAYNFIIEASLRGGEIAGAKTARAIYFGVAGILAVLSWSFITADEEKNNIRNDIGSLRHSMESAIDKVTDEISEIKQSIKEESAPQSKHDAPDTEHPARTEKTDENPDWPNDGEDFVICPQCSKRMTVEFIKLRKRCPDCGCEYTE